MTWTITIPRALVSQNRAAHNRNSNSSHTYRRERERWAVDITLFARGARIPIVTAEYRPRRAVTITRLWGKGQRALDLPNAWGGAKVIIDMLCPPHVYKRRPIKGGPLIQYARPGASLIVDDSPQWAVIKVNQERAEDGLPATRIRIRDLGEDVEV